MGHLIGLKELKNYLDDIVEKADVYRKGGVRLPHMIVNLSPQNGQEMIAAYITKVFYNNHLREFRGLDNLLMYRLDGSLEHMKRVFKDIASNAVYTNEYEGVIAMDVTTLSDYVNERQMEFFIERIRTVSSHATMLFFYDDHRERKLAQVVKTIKSEIDNCIDLSVSPYSVEDYLGLVLQSLCKRGISVDTEREMEDSLCRVIEQRRVSNIREAEIIARDLVFHADFSEFVPRLDAGMVKAYYKQLMKERDHHEK